MSKIIAQIFANNDVVGLKKIISNNWDNILENNRIFYTKYNILDKYPSNFFNEWLDMFGIDNIFLYNLIKKIKYTDDNDNIKFIHLLFYLLDNGKIIQLNYLINKLIYFKLYDIAFVVNIYNKKKDKEQYNNKIIVNKNNSLKMNQMNSLDYYKYNELLTIACKTNNIESIKYLIIDKKIMPSKNDIMLMINKTKKYEKNISELLNYLNKNNFNFKILKNKNKLIKTCCLHETLYIAVTLSEIFSIFDSNIFEKYSIVKLSKLDDVLLLKKMIELKLLKIENLTNSDFLSLSLHCNSFKISDYLINELKIKNIINFIPNYNYGYLVPRSHINAIKFLHKNNIILQQNNFIKLLKQKDIKSVKYCMNNFTYNLTVSKLLYYLLNCNFIKNTKQTLLFLKNNNLIKTIKYPITHVVSVLKYHKINENIELTTGVIKLLLNKKTIANKKALENITKLAFIELLYDVVIYLINDFNVNLKLSLIDITTCFTKQYHDHSSIDTDIQLLKLTKKLFPYKFKQFTTNMPNLFYMERIRKIFNEYDFVEETNNYINNYSIVNNICKYITDIETILETKIPSDVFELFVCSYYNQTGIVFEVFDKLNQLNNNLITKFIKHCGSYIIDFLQYLSNIDKDKLSKYATPIILYNAIINRNIYLIEEILNTNIIITPIYYNAIDDECRFTETPIHLLTIKKIISLLYNKQRMILRATYEKLKQYNNNLIESIIIQFDFNIVDDYKDKKQDYALLN